jgi:hypothetical protein
MSRAEPVYRILLSAAGSDPGAAALLAGQARQRDQGQAQIARSLARARALRPGLRERDAADISTRSCPPRSTGCSSVTEAGRPSGTGNG